MGPSVPVDSVTENGVEKLLEARPKRRSDLLFRSVEGDVVVLDRREEKIHQLNATAAFIWERCDGRHSVVDIAKGLAAHFGADLAVAKGDVAGAVLKLEDLGLLVGDCEEQG